MTMDGTKVGILGATLSVALTLTATTASANVRHEGDWPDDDEPVSLDAHDLTAEEAVTKVANAAGWSVVWKGKAAEREATVSLHVKEQPPAKLLDLILSAGDYVVERDGTMLSIEPADDAPARAKAIASAVAAASSAVNDAKARLPPAPPEPPAATDPPSRDRHRRHHNDARMVTGGHLTVDHGESVGDVTVVGGSVDVLGDVRGDLAVVGGTAHVHDGAEVHGDTVVMGGAVDVDDGATLDGQVTRIGGAVRRRGKAIRAGGDGKGGVEVSVVDDDEDDDAKAKTHVEKLSTRIGDGLSRSSLLFAFGAVLIALATKRTESLQVEVAARPGRTFALGIVGALGAVAATVALCVTVVGIPVAIIGILAGVFLVYGSITAVLTTAGQAMFGHKTKNPYAHLAIGCLAFFIGGSLPFIGHLVVAAVVLTAIGALVATRAGGLATPTGSLGSPAPYRSPSL
jgi:hypothetical protein